MVAPCVSRCRQVLDIADSWRLLQAETSGTLIKFLAENKSMVSTGQVSRCLLVPGCATCAKVQGTEFHPCDLQALLLIKP